METRSLAPKLLRELIAVIEVIKDWFKNFRRFNLESSIFEKLRQLMNPPPTAMESQSV